MRYTVRFEGPEFHFLCAKNIHEVQLDALENGMLVVLDGKRYEIVGRRAAVGVQRGAVIVDMVRTCWPLNSDSQKL